MQATAEPTLRLQLNVSPLPPPTADNKPAAPQANTISALLFEPRDPARTRGGLIVIQEIFGVNTHIREVAKHYSDLGFTVLAPSVFDHVEPGVELEYRDRDTVHGRDLVSKLGWETAIRDIDASVDALKTRLPDDRQHVATIGYCWGGTLAWLAACRLPKNKLSCAVAYYGRQIFDFRHETPQCPMLLHFGEHDPLIPLENIKAVHEAHPDLPLHLYNAGHGFNCDHRKDYKAEAAALAETRTLEFMDRKMDLKWIKQ